MSFQEGRRPSRRASIASIAPTTLMEQLQKIDETGAPGGAGGAGVSHMPSIRQSRRASVATLTGFGEHLHKDPKTRLEAAPLHGWSTRWL